MIKKFTIMLLCVNLSIFSIKTKSPSTSYVHGMGGSSDGSKQFVDQGIILNAIKSVTFPDQISSLGNTHELEAIHANMDKNRMHVLYGFSRGGAAVINYLAKYNPTNITAIVLHATPADMINVVDEWLPNALRLSRSSKEFALRQIFHKYPINCAPPVENIKDIKDKSLPIFIVHSHADSAVNIRSAYQNYKAFKKAGFENVYLLELKESGHNSVSPQDCDMYRKVVHSFYKKHHCGYDEKQAVFSNLSQFQPSIEKINAKIELNEWRLKKQPVLNYFLTVSLFIIKKIK